MKLFAKDPMTFSSLLNATAGMRAKGRVRLRRQFRRSFIRESAARSSSKKATRKAGTTVTDRTATTLRQRLHLRFKNPSMQKRPAWVQAIVEA